jgi:hypothetical protein
MPSSNGQEAGTMADRDDQSNLPPIPDGGLAESMPDWLRRPPAWRTLPDREVAIPEPEDAAELPEPDESVIDPRTFLSDDDLPAWLRNLGRGRRVEPPGQDEPAAVASVEPRSAPSSEMEAFDRPAESAPSRFVPTSPPAPTASPVSQGSLRAVERPASRSAPARQGFGLVALLAGLLLIAVVVIVILLVT